MVFDMQRATATPDGSWSVVSVVLVLPRTADVGGVGLPPSKDQSGTQRLQPSPAAKIFAW